MSAPIVAGWVAGRGYLVREGSETKYRCQVGEAEPGGDVLVTIDDRSTYIPAQVLARQLPDEVLAYQLRAAGWTVTAPKGGEP